MMREKLALIAKLQTKQPLASQEPQIHVELRAPEQPQVPEQPPAPKEPQIHLELRAQVPIKLLSLACQACECNGSSEDSDNDLQRSSALSLSPSSSVGRGSSFFAAPSSGNRSSSGIHQLSNHSWPSTFERQVVTYTSPTVSRCQGSDIYPCLVESPIIEPCKDRSELESASHQSISQPCRCNDFATTNEMGEFGRESSYDCQSQDPLCSILHDAKTAAEMMDVIWTARWMGGAEEGLHLPGALLFGSRGSHIIAPQLGRRLQERRSQYKGLSALWESFISCLFP